MNKEYYKKRIIDLKAAIVKEREAKKKDNSYYANLIKRTSVLAHKTSYRKTKIDRAAAHDRRIESLKRDIVKAREAMKKVK